MNAPALPKSKPKPSTGSVRDHGNDKTPSRADRPVSRRTLDDVVFSLRQGSKRIRAYRTKGDARSLEIERSVVDRLLVEFKDLGGLDKAS